MTKETIVNCWKKSGLIGNSEETNEELITKVEKERSKIEIKSTEDFINLEDDCESSMAILTDKEILNICRKDSENEMFKIIKFLKVKH